jgi:hypothetical protein
MSLPVPRKTVVILLHGIRTMAWWQNVVASILFKKTNAIVLPVKYDYFDLLRFLFPLRVLRRGPIERVRKQIEGIRAQYENDRLVVFAHSFGSYILSRLLIENPYFAFDLIVLCGSIIKRDYDWDRVQSQILAPTKRDSIINECGLRDVFPVLAESSNSDYGASGTYGFGNFNVRDRYHPLKHSDFFNPEFIEEYWVPVVKGDPIDFTPTDSAGTAPPKWFSVFRWIPLRLLLPSSFIVLAFIVGTILIFSPRYETATLSTGGQLYVGSVQWDFEIFPLQPTERPNPTIIAEATFPTAKRELVLWLTRYPARGGFRFDALSRKYKCDRGQLDYCRPSLPVLDISHVITLRVIGANPNEKIRSASIKLREDGSPFNVSLRTDPSVDLRLLDPNLIVVPLSGFVGWEKQNLLDLRRFSIIEIEIQYADDSHEDYSLRKGNSGQRIFASTIEEWLQTVGQKEIKYPP